MTVLLLAIMTVAFLGACYACYSLWKLTNEGCAYTVGEEDDDEEGYN